MVKLIPTQVIIVCNHSQSLIDSFDLEKNNNYRLLLLTKKKPLYSTVQHLSQLNHSTVASLDFEVEVEVSNRNTITFS
jgi:hypothetical protein